MHPSMRMDPHVGLEAPALQVLAERARGAHHRSGAQDRFSCKHDCKHKHQPHSTRACTSPRERRHTPGRAVGAVSPPLSLQGPEAGWVDAPRAQGLVAQAPLFKAGVPAAVALPAAHGPRLGLARPWPPVAPALGALGGLLGVWDALPQDCRISVQGGSLDPASQQRETVYRPALGAVQREHHLGNASQPCLAAACLLAKGIGRLR